MIALTDSVSYCRRCNCLTCTGHRTGFNYEHPIPRPGPSINQKLNNVLEAKHAGVDYTHGLHCDWVLKSGRPGVVVICGRRQSRRRVRRSSAKG